MDAIKIWTLALMTALTLSSCETRSTVKHPDAPMLITETDDEAIRVSVYDNETKSLVDFGWIPVDGSLTGWTISKYDWDYFLRRTDE